MAEPQGSKAKLASGSKAAVGRLFILDLSGGNIFSVNPDGSDRKVIVTGRPHPDGIVVDVEAGHIYWTNMGHPNLNDGSIERADLDGQNRTTIVPEGGTFTPKQLHHDKKSGKLYWCDREGMRVMRSNLDGSEKRPLLGAQGNLTGIAFGEFTRLGSQIEMSRTPEYWADPIIHPIGSSKPEWLPR